MAAITLSKLINEKAEIENKRNEVKKATCYVPSLDGEITIRDCTIPIITDAAELGDEGDRHIVYECVLEPNLKDNELQKAYKCVAPEEIVDKVFTPIEVHGIARECAELGGIYNNVKIVDTIKN